MLRRLGVPLLLALVALPACRVATARSLEEDGVRAEVSQRLYRTLRLQGHYFATEGEARAFEAKLRAAAEGARDASSFYRAVSDSLASLDEGHTGLVSSPEVPFSNTIPPVAILDVDRQAIVAGVAPGVEGGGLKPGDLVLEVDGEPAAQVLKHRIAITASSTLHARRARATANLLAGPTDTPARVRVLGMDGRERYCFPLRFLLDDQGKDRFQFGFLPRDVRAVGVTASAGYISLPDFREGRTAEMRGAVQALRGLPMLVLDLRGNPGGRIRTLRRIAGLFVKNGALLLQLDEGEKREPVFAEGSSVHYRGQLRILVDERTGSAAELLAAALQDLGRARIYGRPTAGSSRTRRSMVLPGGVLFHYAGAAEFRRRDGSAVEGIGVTPDMLVYRSRDSLSRGEYGNPELDPAIRLVLDLN